MISQRRAPVKIALAISAVLALLLVPARWVWLPDIFSGEHKLITTGKLWNSDPLELRQYWGGDFYTTYIRHESAQGKAYHEMLDPDGDKIWNAELKTDEQESKVEIWSKNTKLYEYEILVVPSGFDDSGELIFEPNEPYGR